MTALGSEANVRLRLGESARRIEETVLQAAEDTHERGRNAQRKKILPQPSDKRQQDVRLYPREYGRRQNPKGF